jgi:protein SCO1
VSRKSILTSMLVLALHAAGCTRGASPASEFEATAAAQRYPINGIVRGVNREAGQVTVAHEDIPGLMDAMTMSFAVKEAWAVKVAAPGDRLTGTLVVEGTRSWIEGTSLTTPPQAAGDPAAPSADATAVIGPAAGTPVPSAPLVDQAGRRVTFADFAGRDVIVTFIYTNCPLPDFCPRMMARLNEAAARLSKAGRRDEVQMVAISIDPARDTPKVLEAYGRKHIVEDGDPFAHWSLLTGTPANIRTWASFFALTYEPDGTDIAHGLRTAVIDRDGRVVGMLRDNDWSTNDLMALLPDRP